MKFKPLCTDESAKATLWQTSCAIAGPFLEASDGESDAGPGDRCVCGDMCMAFTRVSKLRDVAWCESGAMRYVVKTGIHVNDAVCCVSPAWTPNLRLTDGAAASASDVASADGEMRLRMNLTAMCIQTIYSRKIPFSFRRASMHCSTRACWTDGHQCTAVTAISATHTS